MWTEIIITLITCIFAPLALMLSREILAYFKAKTQDTRIRAILDDVDASLDTVMPGILNYVAKTKTELMLVEGTIDMDTLQQVLRKAAREAEKTLTAQTTGFLKKNGIDVASYLADKLKAQVLREENRNE